MYSRCAFSSLLLQLQSWQEQFLALLVEVARRACVSTFFLEVVSNHFDHIFKGHTWYVHYLSYSECQGFVWGFSGGEQFQLVGI